MIKYAHDIKNSLQSNKKTLTVFSIKLLFIKSFISSMMCLSIIMLSCDFSLIADYHEILCAVLIRYYNLFIDVSSINI